MKCDQRRNYWNCFFQYLVEDIDYMIVQFILKCFYFLNCVYLFGDFRNFLVSLVKVVILIFRLIDVVYIKELVVSLNRIERDSLGRVLFFRMFI